MIQMFMSNSEENQQIAVASHDHSSTDTLLRLPVPPDWHVNQE